MRIRPTSKSDAQGWQSFVCGSAIAGPFHDFRWSSILSENCAVDLHFIHAEDEMGLVRGVLPMYRTSSRLTGDVLVSLPSGGLAESADVLQALHAYAWDMRKSQGPGWLGLRDGLVPGHDASNALRAVYPTLDVTGSSEAAWRRISKNARWSVRKAQEAGFAVQRDPGAVAVFYAIYAARMHELGTPVIARGLLESMLRHLGSRVQLFMVSRGADPVGGMLCFDTNGLRTSAYAATRSESLHEHANYLLYWNAIAASCEEAGISRFDLGRSLPGSGTHRFKRKWGGIDLYSDTCFYAVGRSDPLPPLARKRGNDSWQRRLWKLMPASLARVAGSRLRRSVPFG